MNYLIDFKDQVTESEISSWLAQNKITDFKVMNALEGVYIVMCETLPQSAEFIMSITEDQNVSNKLLGTVEIIPQLANEVATFDHDADWWKTAVANKVDFTAQTTEFEKRGSKTTVYVIDSGIKDTHPEFADTRIEQLFTFNGDFEDTNGHGTAIASVIGGKTLGITSSTIKSVKVFDKSKTTMTSDIVSAIDAILSDMMANNGAIAIVNMSWAITKDAYIESKIQDLINAGAKVVAAAGNDGTPIQNVTPASMPNVLTVGAFDDNFVPADFSNYTSDIKNTEGQVNFGSLDCWAPGVNIAAALLDGTVGSVAGTSIAAAIASACLAYNSDNLYSNVGFTALASEFLESYTLLKKNLLMLSDKYSGSANVTVGFYTEPSLTWTSGTYSASRIAYDNIDMHGFLTHNAFVNKIELDKDLPAGLSLSNGWIVGRLDVAPDATQEIDYLVTVHFTNGEVNTFNLKLFLAKANTPVGEYPADITPLIDCAANANKTQCVSYSCGAYCVNCDPKINNCPCGIACA